MDPEQNDKKHVDQTSIRSFPDNWVFHFFVLKTQYLLLGPFNTDRLKRDKDGNIAPTELSEVEITDTDASNTVMQEL